MRTFSPIRAALVLSCIGGGLVVLLGRVAFLQTYGRQQIILKAERQQHQNSALQARRGSIFDRNGMLMAGTVQTQSLFIDPKFMQDCYQADGRSLVEMDAAIDRLAKLIDRDPFELARLLGDRYQSRYIRIADNLDEFVVGEIQKMNLPGVGFTPTHVRYYPMGAVAAHVLGGVQKDGPGLEGVELQFDKTLTGRNGYKRTLKDARRRPIGVAAEDYLPPQHGRHLILTLDSTIQLIAEQELAAACMKWKAKRGEAIVMDPKTGDVLAMANWPTFNPQTLAESTPDVRRNRCLTDPYEPGSTIKPFVAGPALAQKVTRVNEVFPIKGPTYFVSVGRYKRKVTDVHPYPQLAMWDVLVKSSNIGMAMLGRRMGDGKLHKAFTAFGFGKQTGIELPGEDPGLVYPLKKWTQASIESVSQGYELMVTPLQLARGFCAYANGGRLVKPRLVRGVLDDGGQVTELDKPQRLDMLPEVVDPITAAEVKRVLCDVLVRGTAQKARSRTWNIFGKTGTAHVSQNGSYNDSSYTSSFVAGAPAEDPRLVVAFIIHEPDRNWAVSQGYTYYGGNVAAPNAARLIERSLAYLQVPASPPLLPPPSHIASVLWGFDPKKYASSAVSVIE